MKKVKFILSFVLLATWGTLFAQTLVVTDDPSYTTGNASSVLDVKSTAKGFLAPRMLQSERLAISSPAEGLLVYQTDGTKGFYYYNGIGWIILSTGTISNYLPLAGGTMTGKLNTVASSTTTAGLNLPHGAAPTTPVNGDIWTTTAGIYSMINGSTIGPLTSASNAFVQSGNSFAAVASLGTNDNYDLAFRTNNTEKMRIAANGDVAIGISTFDATNPEQLVVNAGTTSSVNAIYARGTINNYFQTNIQNSSTGTQASSDVVATANNGTETTNFMDMGINGSGYVYQSGNPIETGLANDCYLLAAGNNFLIVNNNAARDMIFMTGGTASTNERMRITSGGTVTLTGKLSTAASSATTAGLTLPHGAAPTAPVNGDLWSTTTGVFARINGATVGPFGTENTLTFTSPLSRSTNTISIPAATGSVNGYLTSSNWTTFNSKLTSTLTSAKFFVGNGSNVATGVSMSGDATLANTGAVTLANKQTVTVSAPLASSQTMTVIGTSAPTLSIADAVADGSTKGAATFTAADFNSAAGVISLDYANGQKATGSVPGFLSSADWTTFNGKESALTFSSPLSRATNTISIPAATTSVNGYLTSTDWTTFNGKLSLTGGTMTGELTTVASSTTNAGLNLPHGVEPTVPVNGDLWTTTTGIFARINGGTIGPLGTGTGNGSVTSITATSPLTGGTITTTGSIGIPQASGSADGYLASGDWTTFNSKENALTFSSPLSRATNTISIPAATTSVNGYLTSTDWTTFNGKLTSTLATTNIFVGNGSNVATGVALSGDATLANTGALTLANKQTVTVSAPLASSQTMTVIGASAPTLSIADAVADGSTKGAATFAAADFNSAAGVISLDYANGQKATGSVPGFLSSADWTSFNGKLSLSGGTMTGELTTVASSTTNAGLNLPHGIAPTVPVNGDLWTTTTGIFARINGGTIGPLGTGTGNGSVTSITATSPLTGGTITTTGSIGIPQASGSSDGYLASGDWTTFNSKENALTFSSPLSRATNTISIPAATTSVNGYLSGTDWTTFNGKLTSTLASTNIFVGNGSNLATGVALSGDATLASTGALTLANKQTVTVSAPLASSQTMTVIGASAPTLSIADAVADGSTKGAATFAAADFNSAAGVISLDYANGQKATGSVPGFLSSADWTSFNGKLSLSGGTMTGELTTVASSTTNAGLNIPHGAAPTTPANGDLWTTTTGVFARINGGTVGPLGTGTGNGSVTSITATSPLTGGTITTTGSIGIPVATGSANGYLSSGDWTTFNGKENALTFSSPLSRATNTISIPAATTSVNGYLSSTDWTTFNGKLSLTGGTMTGKLNTVASTTTTAGLNLPHGAAPTTPVNGDLWTTTAGVFARINGSTVGPLITDDQTEFEQNGNSFAALATLGTNDNYDLAFKTNSTEKMRISAGGNVGIGTSTFDATNPEKLVVNAGTTTSVNAIYAKGTINNYFQTNIQNLSSGTQASSDVVTTANNGTETTNFMDMGINGGGYVYQNGNPIETGLANDCYLLAAGNNFLLVNNNAAKDMIFMTGGTASTNERMRILSGGNVGIGISNPAYKLDVAGNLNISTPSASSTLTLDAQSSQTNIAKIIFKNSAGIGDFQIGGDGGDIIWQGGGGRNLEMGAYHSVDLYGGRTSTSALAFTAGSNGAFNTRILNSNNSIGLMVQGVASQSVNLQEWRNSLGTGLSAVAFDGSLGVGTATPASLLSVGGSSQFQVNSTGNLVKINNVAASWPSTQGAASSFLKNDGSGNFSWATGVGSVTSITATSPLTGGTITTSGSIGIPVATGSANGYLSSGDWTTFNGKLSLGGGTMTGKLNTLASSTTTAGLNLPHGAAPTTPVNGDIWTTTAGIYSRINGATIGPLTNAGSNAFAQNGNSFAALANLGTNDNYDLAFETYNSEKMRISAGGNVAIGSTTFDGTNPEKLKVNAGTTTSFNLIKGTGSINNYLQLNIQNTSNGSGASTDLVATNDIGDENYGYIDMGINSSTYNNATYSIGGFNDSYILCYGSATTGGNLDIGTASNASIKFNTNGSLAANERMRIDPTGKVGIGITNPAAKLDVNGSIKLGPSCPVLGGILKTNVSVTDATAFDYTTSRTETVTVTGAAVNATVIVNPRSALTGTIAIGYSYVSAANTVKINIINSGNSAALGTVVFDITIIQ